MIKHIWFLISFLLLKNVFACSCSLGDVNQKFNEARQIFIGHVKSVKFTGEINSVGDKRTVVTFISHKSWKDKKSEYVLHTADNKVSCEGYWFKEGQIYLVYVYPNEGRLSTLYCGGVIPKSDLEDFNFETNKLDQLAANQNNPKSIE